MAQGRSPAKRGLGIDVLEAARQRISMVFDRFPRVIFSFSGGKDSTVGLHLTADEARRRNRRFALFFVDLEAQYKLTIEHTLRCFEMYQDCADPYWLALPLNLRNAVSQFEPHWVCWDPDRKPDWVRKAPPKIAISDPDHFSWFRPGMEFEELVPEFGAWYGGGRLTCQIVSIRSDESLNRWRTVSSRTKTTFDGLQWTTWTQRDDVFSAYPIYDWRTEDIWTYHARFPDRPHNLLYERMHRAGLSIHQARICQPYGDDQRRGLWLFHVIEPETWGRVVARVNGANQGALYSKTKGNILGMIRIDKPEGHTWESFAVFLLDSMPEGAAEHYRNKISIFLKWWFERGYPNGIPDEAEPSEEASKKAPSWRRICKTLLRNDYHCKGLSFSVQGLRSPSYERYKKIMKNRRRQWGIFA